MMSGNKHDFSHRLETSTVLTVLGIILLFSGAVVVTLWAPRFIDPTWTQPASDYQVQMYEIADFNLFLGSAKEPNAPLEAIYHIQEGSNLLAFHESRILRIVAPPELEKYVTRYEEKELKLTSDLLILRPPEKKEFDAIAAAENLRKKLQGQEAAKVDYQIVELFKPDLKEAFALGSAQGGLENWVDKNFRILDESPRQAYHLGKGVIYIENPVEYRYSEYVYTHEKGWRYDPNGRTIASLEDLQKPPMNFRSRHELITLGEHLYAIEGCWYCHTDQTRTLVQDVVVNGSDSYPAPPSSANEYIYQAITFPGTRRIGPDLSRVGVKRPSRDWHKAHFWAPKTASPGSIMPSFQHFFDNDPRGTGATTVAIPNWRFEAIFQYLMTKGTRITPPTQAWWLGKDPIQTIEIIEGRKVIP